MRLSRLGEFGAIERIKGICREAGRGVAVGIGDDAAAIRHSGRALTLVSTDMLVEGVHFDLAYTPLKALGFKALSVNISDIAAMGGLTRYYLTSLALGRDFRTEDLDGLYSGMEDAAGRFGVRAVGGDTCSSPGPIAISVTVIGEPAGRRPVTRSGASPGDDIYVTGTLGDSAGGLELLRAGVRSQGSAKAGAGGITPLLSPLNLRGDEKGVTKEAAYLIERHLMPVPKVGLATELARAGLATSMIDISDGFSSDLMHVLDASGAGAEVELDALPVSMQLMGVFGKRKAALLALHGGEDYELLFTAHRRARKAVERLGGCVRVGRITEGGAYLLRKDGTRVRLKARGYEHFRV